MFLLLPNGDKAHRLEVINSTLQKEKLLGTKVPDFSLGLDHLHQSGLCDEKGKEKCLRGTSDVLDDPSKYFCMEQKQSQEPKEEGDFLVLTSESNNTTPTRFLYHPQPDGSPGRSVAMIHIMHWNGRIKPYNKIISFLRSTGLPISTLLHIPAGRGLNPGHDSPIDYEIVSPNIGKTVANIRQSVLDVQQMALFLKEKLGYAKLEFFLTA